MADPIWNGAIALGQISIPIALHPAVRDVRPRFNLLHAKDQSPVRIQRICILEDRSVGWNELVKGYEYEKGKFVVLTDEDFVKAALEKSKTMDIMNFVNAEEVDDRFFETPYYVIPDVGGKRGYALLREALRESRKIAIGKIILREIQHLAAVTPIGTVLVLNLGRATDARHRKPHVDRWPDTGVEEVRPEELDMAKALVQTLTTPWKPERYTDEYRANLIRIIQAKVRGTQPQL
ncbi:MAG: Ku protein, partial [Nitrospiraceae bacterium]